MSKDSKYVNPDGTVTVKGEDGKFKGKIGKPQNPKTSQTLPLPDHATRIFAEQESSALTTDVAYKKATTAKPSQSLTLADAEKLANAKLMVNALGDLKWVNGRGDLHNENGPALVYSEGLGEVFYKFIKETAEIQEGIALKKANSTGGLREFLISLGEFRQMFKLVKSNRKLLQKGNTESLTFTHAKEVPTNTVANFQAWVLNGMYHREDGPAVEMSDGRRIWAFYDYFVTENPNPLHTREGEDGLTIAVCEEAYDIRTPENRLRILSENSNSLISNTAKKTLQKVENAKKQFGQSYFKS